MRKRLSSKLLAVILTVAICATTVFGCLMTVNAADSCYSFGSVEVSNDLTEATIGVTFTAPASLPNGFIAGAFSINEVDADAADKLTIKSVSGSGVSAEIEGNNVVFNTDAAKSIATVQLTFGFSKGKATKGKDYKIQLSGIELAYNDSEYYVESATGAIGKISTECEHVIGVVGEPLKIDTANNYSVYENSVCTICGEEFGIQLVPTAEKLNADGAAGTVTGKVVYWDNTKTAPTSTAAGTKDDPIIISTPAELAYIATATNSAGTVNPDKYYKVADDVKAFVLQPETYGADIMALSGSDAVSAYFSDTSKTFYQWQGVSDYTNIFSGHFDGNGITVYGLYNTQNSKRQGLFGEVDGNATICNVNVKGAYITTTSGWVDQGAIVGGNRNKYGVGPGTSGQDTLVIKNCSVIDCYMRSSDTANDNRSANGVIAGRSTAGLIMIDSCFVSGNDTLFTNNTLSQEYSLYGNALNSWNIDSSSSYFRGAYDNYYPNAVATAATGSCICNMVVNTVAIGTLPYHLGYYGNRLDNKECFINVYTDGPAGTVANSYISGGNTVSVPTTYAENQIASVATANLKGSAAAIAMPNLDWGKTWLVGKEGEYPYLAAPDYVSDTICWDGTVATGIAEGTGTDTDPFVINSVSEFAYVVGLGNETEGKYYKFADGIKNVVLQKYAYANDIMALDSAADVQAYFEGNSITPQQWIFKGWAANAFSGKFDGNGAIVYGMYSVYKDGAGNSNPALFPTIDTGAEISNLSLKNSYVYGREGWDAGLISAIVASGTYGTGKNNGVVEFNNCAVINNYMRYYTNRGAIFFASAQGDVAKFENILVYGNDAKNMTGDISSLAIGMKNDIKDAEGNFVFASFKNMVVFGAIPYGPSISWRTSEPQCFSNVYTDAPAGEVYAGHPFAENQVKSVPVADILGSQAKNTMPNLAWGTDWYCGAEGEPPVLAPFATLGASDKSTFAHQLYGSSVTYNNDGTLDFNLHFVPQYEGIEATLYVGTADTSKFYKLTATESSYRDDLGGTALMFTLPNISARDIDKVWLPTLVVGGGEKTEWGKTQPVALVDNAMGVLEGDYASADKQVSAALINYNATADDALSITKNDYTEGTVDLLEFGDYLINDLGSTSKWYDNKLADNGETGADWANAIIIDSAEEFVYLCKASGNDTIGKYYKVADGIAGFNLATDKLDINGTLTGKSLASGKTNIDIVKGSGKNHSGGTPGFQGHFDGNGATVYGAWTNHNSIPNYAGLFSCVKGNVTIKNINVKLSYFVATYAAGGIVGYHSADTKSTLTIENCSVTETYIESTGVTGYGSGAGAIIGRGASAPALREANDQKDYNGDGDMVDTIYQDCPYNVTNCYVNLDPANIVSAGSDGIEESKEAVIHGGVVAFADSNAVMVSNCVVIGITPYPITDCTTSNAIQHSAHANNFSNVYTDQYVGTAVYVGGTVGSTQNLTTVMTQLTTEQITGLTASANMPKLDWVNTWTTTDGYPALINKDYKAPASGVVAAWDGTVATGFASGTGTKENPYIISTAAEFAYMVKDNASYTPDKYFKVADGISAFVMQKPAYAADIMSLNSAADTKAYFEANAANMLKWPNYGWEGSCFAGTFDGNGATVYGLYQVSTNNAGLFSTVDAGTTIKNIAVKNSYLTSTASNYQVAAIAAVAAGDGYGVNNQGIIWFDRCIVANNYMYNASTQHVRSGLIFGVASYDTACFDNCLVYGNDATYGDGVKMALVSSVTNGILSTTAKTPEGLEVKYSTEANGKTLVYKMVRNTVVLGSELINVHDDIAWRRNDPGCYVNCYTDGASGEVAFNNGTWTYTDAQVKYVNATDALGADAKTNLANLGWAEDGTGVWYVGAAGDMPGFKEAGAMPTNFQAMLNGVTFTTPDTVGAGTEYNTAGNMVFGVYQTALSLKANPYMSFAFAFGGDYKTNRDKIKIRFTYTENGALTTSNEISVPAYTGEDIKNVNGWTNTTANGRFHTFKADMIPVEALAYGIKVEVNYNNTGWEDFGTYSVEGLGMQFDALSKTQPGDYYSTRVEAAKALLFYAQAIAARYGAQ